MPLYLGTRRPLMSASSSAAGWQSVTSNALAAADDAGWSTFTIVQFIDQASLLVTGGTQVRLTLKAPAATGFSIARMYAQSADAGYTAASPAFSGSPVQVLFGGLETVSTAGGAADQVSDAFTLAIPAANGLCISWDGTGTNTHASSAANTPTNWKVSYKNAGGADAVTVAKSLYTDFTATKGGLLIKLVEVFL